MDRRRETGEDTSSRREHGPDQGPAGTPSNPPLAGLDCLLEDPPPCNSHAKTSLAHLRQITLTMEELSDPIRETTTFSAEALGEIAATTRAAAVELAYYRTLFTPGFVGEEGLRFSLEDDKRTDYAPRTGR